MVADKSSKRNGTVHVEGNVIKGPDFILQNDYTNIADRLLEKMKSRANDIGQIDCVTGKQDTFGNMRERTIKCALWLRKQGIRPGDVIAVCTHNHLDSVVPCVAALCVGAVFNTWDQEMNTQTARHFLSVSAPKMVFANESSIQTILEAMKIEKYSMKIVAFGQYPGAQSFAGVLESQRSADLESFRCTPIDDVHSNAAILYSSGTTGPAKGVQLSHYTLLYQTDPQNGFDLNGTLLWFSSLYWISGVLLSLSSIVTHTPRLIYPTFDEETTCKLIEKYKVNWLFVGTSMAVRLVKWGFLDKYDLSSLKSIFTGGSILKQETQNEMRRYLPNTLILQAYGMTELGGLGTTQLAHSKSGSCGVPAKNVQLKVIDINNGKSLGPNQQGELCVKSPTMTKGYYRNPEATKNAIDSEGWLHTGDLVYYDEDCELFVLDRLKELIKVREHQVCPCDIETLLQSHPEVVEVAVVAVPHEIDGEHPIAFVSRSPDGSLTERELIDLVARNLSEYHQLRAGVRFMKTLPHTASGKVARRDLKVMAKAITA